MGNRAKTLPPESPEPSGAPVIIARQGQNLARQRRTPREHSSICGMHKDKTKWVTRPSKPDRVTLGPEMASFSHAGSMPQVSQTY